MQKPLHFAYNALYFFYKKLPLSLQQKIRATIKRKPQDTIPTPHKPMLGDIKQKTQLSQFQNCHAGKPCFIVGNGPSLRNIDMSTLKNELTFGSNRVHLGFSDWGFHFNYWTVGDGILAEQIGGDLSKELPHDMIKFIPRALLPHFNAQHVIPINYGPGKPFPRFSDNPSQLYPGFTITYALIQLASIMSCSPMYLIGVDHSYNIKKEHILGKDRWHDTSSSNHFHKDYSNSQKGQQWTMPQIENMEQAYDCAARWALAKKTIIVNLTPGTHLKSFPRGNFSEITKSSYKPRKIWFDVSTLYFSKGAVTGVPKVVNEICKGIYAKLKDECNFFVTDKFGKTYVIDVTEDLLNNFNVLEKDITIRLVDDFPFQDGCTIISLGAIFLHPQFIDKLIEHKDKVHFEFISMIHDLIPLRLRDLTPAYLVDAFESFVPKIAKLSSCVLFNSNFTQSDYLNFIEENSIKQREGVKYIAHPLAADIENNIRPPKGNALQKSEFILCVASSYPRKNQSLVLSAYQHMKNTQKQLPKIVLVTKKNPYFNEILASVSEEVKIDLVVFENLEGCELRWLYENCLFTVFPSSFEGFGLPIIESLLHNKPCISASNTSLIEAGMGFSNLVEGVNPAIWAKKMLTYINNREMLAEVSKNIKENCHVQSWPEYRQKIVDDVQVILQR